MENANYMLLMGKKTAKNAKNVKRVVVMEKRKDAAKIKTDMPFWTAVVVVVWTIMIASFWQAKYHSMQCEYVSLVGTTEKYVKMVKNCIMVSNYMQRGEWQSCNILEEGKVVICQDLLEDKITYRGKCEPW